ncbi:hypothetical protein Q5P01_015164 [Channa striata]|uniref:Uncharacterized protein n=1 Tax=Channa striata TaxID=64152 RepID=A0AA88SIK2_CHASR|nr:hypothetical protein Q5P01_015164 [Channa striata]
MSSNLQVLTVLSLMSLLSCCSSGYELQDTIHALKEENLQLQHRLENLTEALRDLKHLLTEHSKGISAETHQMLEQAFCLPELHNAAHAIFITPTSLLLLVLVFVLLTQLL